MKRQQGQSHMVRRDNDSYIFLENNAQKKKNNEKYTMQVKAGGKRQSEHFVTHYVRVSLSRSLCALKG